MQDRKQATIVADLGFGDAGKGSIVDYLAGDSTSPVVVRYNGGPQAAHNVITEDGMHHTFAQFGSGSFRSVGRTYLSRHMLINPLNAFVEAEALLNLGVSDIWLRTAFDEEAMVITPFHVAANHLRELARGDGVHGSCGQGIGETRSLDIRYPDLTVRIQDLADRNGLVKKLMSVQDALRIDTSPLWPEIRLSEQAQNAMHTLSDPRIIGQTYQAYRQFLRIAHVTDAQFLRQLSLAHDHVIFEGAQGVLLDEKYGFHPHTTWSNITLENAFSLLRDIDYAGPVTKLGLLRGYSVRHGAGPFVTEDDRLTASVPDAHNDDNRWQRAFRVGHPDLVAWRYGITAVGGVDELAITNLDRMRALDGWKVATGYKLSMAEQGLPDDLFDFDGGAAVGIKFKSEKDLDRQQAITNKLLSSKPVYQELETPSGRGILATETDFEEYLSFLSQRLNAPISLTSFGPTAGDKKRRIPALT